jgi:hypothetical protein
MRRRVPDTDRPRALVPFVTGQIEPLLRQAAIAGATATLPPLETCDGRIVMSTLTDRMHGPTDGQTASSVRAGAARSL